MIRSEDRGCIVDYQQLAVDLKLSVAEDGGPIIRFGEQRFYEGPLSFPYVFSGDADVCEWYDDAAECFRRRVCASNPRWGKLFGYTGSFHVEGTQSEPPRGILPRRIEARE